MKHLIIGAGAAGISAAHRIVKEKPQDRVTIVSEDREVYSRCMIHKFIGGERDAASINFINDDLLANKNVEWISGVTLTRLDGAAKAVYAGDKLIATGDTILIATGSVSVTPPIGELKTAKNAFGLRHLSDARSIAEGAKKAERIAVIGAGLVGLDAVYGILEQAEKLGRKPQITVIEMAPTALAINLDAHAAEAYQRLFEARGVTFHLGSKVIDTKGDGAGNITSVELEGGTSVPCDLVIMAVGVRPAAAFLEGSGVELTERRAVKVNDYLETSLPGIYAAGDVAGLSGIWPNAQKQGEYAAYNMTGTRWAYDDRFAIKNTVNFFGLLSLSLGAINPQEGDEVLIKEDRNNYRKLILRGGVPAGVILQGEIGGSGFWLQLIKDKIPVSGLGKSPWKVSYADFYGLETNGEYKWVV
ncbi:MAG: FAD-dependent oxidoreductase [Spirochaetaceae bacterium]|jgi:NAD(P)H-nitrite reductase large subunit|nr:FAD-dependent oxidoreductase [Spirochaetaceae bacterium]